MEKLYVLKYGGSTIASPELIKKRASYVSKLHKEGHKAIVVVSAMGQTTNDLYKLAHVISKSPTTRELDVLLTSGERISMALMCMALHENNCKAISFTGSQAGILTHGSHSTSFIKEIKPIRVEQELNKNKIVVIAGFQGVNPETKDITTLGRGGSDTTAIALARYFKTNDCYILKDVDGVYDKDPSAHEDAKKFDEISTLQLKNMTLWGAKLCHYKAAQEAYEHGQSFYIGSAGSPDNFTKITADAKQKAAETCWNNVLRTVCNDKVNNFLSDFDLAYLSSKDENSYWAGSATLINSLTEQIKKQFNIKSVVGSITAFHNTLKADTDLYKTNGEPIYSSETVKSFFKSNL